MTEVNLVWVASISCYGRASVVFCPFCAGGISADAGADSTPSDGQELGAVGNEHQLTGFWGGTPKFFIDTVTEGEHHHCGLCGRSSFKAS